jgi:hypothetical protein
MPITDHIGLAAKSHSIADEHVFIMLKTPESIDYPIGRYIFSK